MNNWISVKEKIPSKGEIVVVWLSRQKEPCCVRYDVDKYGPIWTELVPVDIYTSRQDLVTHWMPHCKENCRWATLIEQAKNKRKSISEPPK